jgi:predicted metal-dependent phosphoesterase TrpH
MNSLRIKIELHTHTDFDPLDLIDYSACQLIDEAAQQGFQVLAITCHDALQWSQPLVDYAQEAGILLIPGVEATIEGKHVLIYGLEHFKGSMSFAQLRALRHSQPEVFTIAPHPFFPGRTCLGKKFMENHDCFDAIEYSHFYTHKVNFNQKAVEMARAHKKPIIGTSDVHVLKQLGRTYSFINAAERTFSAISAAIRAGEIELVTEPLTWPELAYYSFQMGKVSLKSRCMRLGLLSRRPTEFISSFKE